MARATVVMGTVRRIEEPVRARGAFYAFPARREAARVEVRDAVAGRLAMMCRKANRGE